MDNSLRELSEKFQWLVSSLQFAGDWTWCVPARQPSTNNTNPGLASVILAEVCVVVLCLNIQFVMYLHDASDMPG